MNNLVIYGNACGSRKAVQIEEIRFCTAFLNVIVGYTVDLIGCYSRFDRLAGCL